MGTVVMKIKLMPESPETNLQQIKDNAKEIAEQFDKVKVHEIQEEPIAFGLVAVIITVIWPEDKDPDLLENSFKGIAGVESVQVIDARRLL